MINEKLNKNIIESITHTQNQLNQMKWKVLWSNPNPNSDFDEQDIDLSSSDFDHYYVIAKTWRGNRNLCMTNIVPKSFDAMIYNIEGSTIYSRTCLHQNLNKMHIGGSTVSNSYCIPIYVIGIKTSVSL